MSEWVVDCVVFRLAEDYGGSPLQRSAGNSRDRDNKCAGSVYKYERESGIEGGKAAAACES